MRWFGTVLSLLLALAVTGCEGDQGSSDAAIDGLDGDGGDDPGDRDEPTCHLEDGFCLILEPGARACSIWPDHRAWESEVGALGTVEFTTGTIELPRDPTPFEVQIVSRILHGRQRLELTAQGPGTFTYEFIQQGDPQSGFHRFAFEQRFDLLRMAQHGVFLDHFVKHRG